MFFLFLFPGCTLVKASLPRQGPTEPVAKIENISIPLIKGNIGSCLYPGGNGPFPILVYNHGGGWIAGSTKYQDKLCRYLANKVPCVVVSVNYRLAPIHKFPIPVEDCYAATMWAFNNARSINGDPVRLAVGGDSAGGNLSAAVCLMAKDRGGPPIIFQLLVIPSTNLSSLDTESYRMYATGHELTRRDVEIAGLSICATVMIDSILMPHPCLPKITVTCRPRWSLPANMMWPGMTENLCRVP